MKLLSHLDTLEDKIHFFAVRITQTTEENLQLKDELSKEKKKNTLLTNQIDTLKSEKEGFDKIKQNVKEKIEKLIIQLSENQDEEPKTDQNLTLEEAEALSKPFAEDLLNDTAISFFSDEDY